MANAFDIVVVGGGHAGCEAAAAAARRGASVALVTFCEQDLGKMSCNPAIGGLGKGHLVREVDAMDGLIGQAADSAAIHHRMLNASKGAAVRGPRVQADRRRFSAAIQNLIKAYSNISIIAGEVADILVTANRIEGVLLSDGSEIASRTVVLATGTFLGGKLFRGQEIIGGGRVEERAATRLGERLRGYGLPIGRLKTGTPPRIDGRTIDWARLERQDSDDDGWTFSMLSGRRQLPQVACAITRTNAKTHEIIRAGLDQSPLFSGAIEGRGPRYCPSIEDKIFRFGDRDGHQIFLEPEGLDTPLVYPNGISTSLPTDVQTAMVRSMAGLSNAKITAAGYAVEYDFLDPRALDRTLSLTTIAGLYCAGQVNGTTGYEEAAAQGLVAGANAAAYALDLEPLILDRASSYIGVMIDDLVLQGVTEPYRMLTARAEYRLHLRSDNAGARLTPKATGLGLVRSSRRHIFEERLNREKDVLAELSREETSSSMQAHGFNVRQDGARRTMMEWLRFPEVFDNLELVDDVCPKLRDLEPEHRSEVIENARYAPYLERQSAEIRELRKNEMIIIPNDFPYRALGGLSREMVERLEVARPDTLAAASRIRGITPAALTAILVSVRRRAA